MVVDGKERAILDYERVKAARAERDRLLGDDA